MPKVRVRIFERDGEFYVEPPTVFLGYSATAADNDKLRIFNSTAEDLVFQIDSDEVFGAAAGTQAQLIKAGKSAKIPVVATAVDGKEYAYRIFMVKSGKKAKGNSDPVLIIDN
jgi:hypothetical protein